MFHHLICMSAYYFRICAFFFLSNTLHEQIVLFFSLWNEYIWTVSHKWECCHNKYHHGSKSSHPPDIQYISTTFGVITCNITIDMAVQASVTVNITPTYNCTVIRKRDSDLLVCLNHLLASTNTKSDQDQDDG